MLAMEGVTVGEDKVSRLMFVDDFVGISEAPEGLQKQIGKALEYTRKRSVTANVQTCAVVVCNEHKVNPVTFKWKRGEDELPIADQHTYLGVENNLTRLFLVCTHRKSNRNRKAHIGKMDSILTDSHLDTRIQIPCMHYDGCDCPKARICRKSMGREHAKFIKQMEPANLAAANKAPGCSRTTSNTVARAALGMGREKVEMAI